MSDFVFKLVYDQGKRKRILIDFKGIPHLEWWEMITTASFGIFQKKRSRSDRGFDPIDEGLKNYWQLIEMEFDESEESKRAVKRYKNIKATTLLDIYRECQTWMDETCVAGKKSAAVKKRDTLKNWVMSLMRNVKVCADSLTKGKVQSAGQLRWKMLRQDLKQLGFMKGSKKPVKALDSPYWSEANLGGANPHHFKGDALQREWEQSDEKYLFAFTRKNASTIGAYKVHYVKKSDLWKHQVVIQNGKLHRIQAPPKKHGALRLLPITCTGWLFIVLRNGNLYASMGAEKGNEDCHFHHSSIPAGDAVIMAGAIDAQKGKLNLLDGCSGHYKPKPIHLVNALEVLEQKNVNLTGTQIEVFERVKLGSEWTILPKRFKTVSSFSQYAKKQG